MIYKESETLELKSSFKEWKEIIISLVAFVITFFKEQVKEGIKGGIKLLLYTIKEKPGKWKKE